MKLFSLSAVATATLISANDAFAVPVPANGKCTALVVGGHGSRQNYVASAVSELVKAGASYDVVVSTGASVIAAQAAASGPTANFASNCVTQTRKLTAQKMYSKFPGGIQQAVDSQRGGFYNDTVSQNLYSNILSNPSGTSSRTVVAVAVSLTSTLQVPLPVATGDAATVQNSVDALTASAADPTTYEAFQATFEGSSDLYVAGSTRSQVNVFEAVAQCRAKGAADEDITVDVVYTAASDLNDRDVSKDKTLEVILRADAIEKYVAAQNDIVYAKAAYPTVNFRYEVSPTTALLTDTTDYNVVSLLAMQSRGSSDAKAEISRVKAGVECNPAKQAPTNCVADRDCYTWAAKACFDGSIPKKGRCLVTSQQTKGKCSFDADEIATFRAAQVTRDANSGGVCIGVAFSGGGDRGAYEAGVVSGLTDNTASSDVAWQSVSGVSVGSIIGAALSRYPIGQEDAAADFMVNTALGVTRDVIYTNWTNLIPFIGPKGVVRGFLFESGLFDSSGERKFLTEEFPATPLDPSENYRTFSVMATDMATGEGNVFISTGFPGTTDDINHLMASSAIPGAFPTVVIDDTYYHDGGVFFTIDVFNAVQNCRNLGFADSAIQVDTVGVAGYVQTVLPAGAVFSLTSTQIKARVEMMQQIDDLMGVIDFYRNARPELFRLNIFPSQTLPGTGMDFEVAQMQQMVEIGETDGKTAAGTLADIKSGSLPKACAYTSAKVACGADKDCFNWSVEKCASQLSKTTCDHTKRQCVFAK